jgi:hypothetical protein
MKEAAFVKAAFCVLVLLHPYLEGNRVENIIVWGVIEYLAKTEYLFRRYFL